MLEIYGFSAKLLNFSEEIYQHLLLEKNFDENGKEINDNAGSGCLILIKYSGCTNAHYLHSASVQTQLSNLGLLGLYNPSAPCGCCLSRRAFEVSFLILKICLSLFLVKC